jgi:hypothetical protein
MKITIEMPIKGTYYEDTGRKVDVRPMQLPFNLSYSATSNYDFENGIATVKYDIDDSELTSALITAINAFAAKDVVAKRAQIEVANSTSIPVQKYDPETNLPTSVDNEIVVLGDITGTYQKLRENP